MHALAFLHHINLGLREFFTSRQFQKSLNLRTGFSSPLSVTRHFYGPTSRKVSSSAKLAAICNFWGLRELEAFLCCLNFHSSARMMMNHAGHLLWFFCVKVNLLNKMRIVKPGTRYWNFMLIPISQNRTRSDSKKLLSLRLYSQSTKYVLNIL